MSFADSAQYAIDQAYRGLNPEERETAADTTWEIRPSPTPQDYAKVGAQPGDTMVGLFSQPGGGGSPTVTLFQQPIQALDLPAWVVVEHELTHVLGYDHALREVQVDHGCGVSRATPMPGRNQDCPVCQIYELTAKGAGLVEDAAWRTRRQGHIPQGLGGTIPEARLAFLRAEALTEKLPGMLPDRSGEVRNLRQCIQHMVMALSEWISPDQLPALAQQAKDCRQTAHTVAWIYYSTNPLGCLGVKAA